MPSLHCKRCHAILPVTVSEDGNTFRHGELVILGGTIQCPQCKMARHLTPAKAQLQRRGY